MDVAYNRHSPSSRRSHPSLNHLSLAPLTPRFPISDPHSLPSPPATHTPNHSHQRTSYIEPRSTPPTPSILSRAPSRTRLQRGPRSKSTHHLTALTSLPLAPVPKSKSSISVTLPSSRPTRFPSAREDSEWLLRAGAVIASSTRESKGQSWLATRSSSTSLVDAEDEDGEDNGDEDGVGEGEVADDEFSPALSRRGSGSRFASARSSRRGSRIGSRVEFGMAVGGGKMGRGEEGAFVEGPDFVDGGEEEEEEGVDDGEEEVDEVELRRLTREKGFGLGGWVDRFIGWSLFRVEDEERVDGDGGLDARLAEGEVVASGGRRKREENERVVGAPMDERIEDIPPPGDGEGGWQDAAWLLGVASKVIL